jgi:hypothetical protein
MIKPAYQKAKEARDSLDAELCDAGARSMATRKRLANIMGIEAFNAMNMTPDAIKLHPDYIAARKRQNEAFAALQQFNAGFVKAFKKDIAADIHAKRLAGYGERHA